MCHGLLFARCGVPSPAQPQFPGARQWRRLDSWSCLGAAPKCSLKFYPGRTQLPNGRKPVRKSPEAESRRARGQRAPRRPSWCPGPLICTPGDRGLLPPSRGPATRRDTSTALLCGLRHLHPQEPVQPERSLAQGLPGSCGNRPSLAPSAPPPGPTVASSPPSWGARPQPDSGTVFKTHR